ncbi:Pls/PosA family non-ribosomal peptide synthetase [Streptomyces cadmiisoli]|uniref:Peptide synthetase n=1 Tax=Streptomyces cadmiisoli TaxID=2184053 RepID=A0A2Z4J892_9ACTN|nr:Pls/PosA family non-ribosomal peptide synthetase [Streptomyces cadmiisoli]AWW41361.1 peptide synthetase [Streptomyces cadmiisoli]
MTGQQLKAVETAAVPDTEVALAGLLADVAKLDEVPFDSHFFNDLGADSLVMAHFCARVRKRPDLPSVSMRDIYRYPTISALVAALAGGTPQDTDLGAPPITALDTRPPAEPIGRPHFVLCGVLQALCYLGYASLVAVITTRGYEWIAGGKSVLASYARSVVFGAVLLVVLCALPIVMKWLLIGRWKPQRIRIWSLPYVRFWLVRTLVRSSPARLFAGSPLYPLYLRALGARVGRGVTFLSRSVPVCTDLLTIGENTVVRKDSLISCYHAHDGVIETGPVTLGRDAVVSEATVLDIGTRLGDGSQLGHASSLHTGQQVPDGERWHGSPGEPTDAEFQPLEAARCGTLRRAVHGVLLLLVLVTVYVPLAVGCLDVLLTRVLASNAMLREQTSAIGWNYYGDLFVVTVVGFALALPASLVLMATVPRLLARFVTLGRTYPLYGFHHGVHRAILLLTNSRFLTRLFGDSSAIVYYLRWIGYDLRHVEQSGSNFGTGVKHESPFASKVGSGTMVADGLSLMNADYSSTSFRVSRIEIGAHNFLGNRISYPARGRTGDNCLLATKVMVPVDGPVRHDVGLLGSPSFEIPRSVVRDSTFDEVAGGDGLRRGLAGKNRHNAATVAWTLFVAWLYLFCVAALYSTAASLYARWGTTTVALANALALPFTVFYFVVVERIVAVRHRPGPLFCSIYDRRFWQRERYWKVPAETYLQVLNGTPFKGFVWRMLGADVGTRLFDDGCHLTDRWMVRIGDNCTINAGTVIQCHSQEDGAFKSDRVEIGSGCTFSVGAYVHYGVRIGDGAVLATDSFLMKGEVVPERARWAGNPARPALEGGGEA